MAGGLGELRHPSSTIRISAKKCGCITHASHYRIVYISPSWKIVRSWGDFAEESRTFEVTYQSVEIQIGGQLDNRLLEELKADFKL